MNQFLYLDNFRGFSDTYISIEDVNFLVGENSTGKTSVLGLLQTISSDNFFEKGNEFRGSRINFGSFSDIVSAHSKHRDYFRIGLGWENVIGLNENKKSSIPTGFLATYVKSDDGHDVMPLLKEITLCQGDTTTSLLLQTVPNGGQNGGFVSLRYKSHNGQSINSLTTLRESIFPQWVRAHANRNDESTYALALKSVPAKTPTLVLLMIALQDNYKNHVEHQDEDKEKMRGILSGIFTMSMPKEHFVWMAPIRTTPERVYFDLTRDYSPGGEHTPYLLRRMLQPGTKKKATETFQSALRNVGKSSRLFEDVKIKSHGEEATAPFEVDVVLDGEALNLCTVGYGVSQSLPVLVEILTRTNPSRFAIQQPEVHLHPRAQAALGDTLFQTAVKKDHRFLVETHSDFMIDRFCMNFRDSGKKKKPKSQILFFERKDRKNVVTPIPIDQDGKLSANQPDTYRRFFRDEEMRFLRIK